MQPATILIVDDDPYVRTPLKIGLEAVGYTILAAENGKKALRSINEDIDLVLLDFNLPDTDGLILLEKFKKDYPDTVVIMMTAHGTIDRAVEAMKQGAFHFMTKPVDLTQMLVFIEKGLETTHLKREVRALRADRLRPYAFETLISESTAMKEIKTLLQKTAASPASTVLLLGESGTGKGLAAHIIHYNSDRQNRQFMNITCSALPANLLESELFGHERGAFTDAKQQKKGLLELADGGTVFLDEFTEMDTILQAKLLRFLEDKTFKRIGGNQDIKVDVRVIAATNRDMEEAVAAGVLRKDLYYRLQVLTIDLPPMRQRGTKDILAMAKFFIDFFNKEFRKDVKGLTPDALRLLEGHLWEGNVRELRNAIERAMLFAEGQQLTVEDFATLIAKQKMTNSYQLPPGGINFEELEQSLVIQALDRAQGNRTRAAAILCMTRDQIRYRIEKFKLE